MKKRIISICLTLVMATGIFAALPVTAEELAVAPVAVEEGRLMTAQEMQSAIEGLQSTVYELRAILQMLVQELRGRNTTPTAPAPQAETRSERADRPARAERPPRPTNPPITQERAIEIAFAYAGVGGTLDEASLDFEKGQWVWEVEIDFPDRRELEIYIDINTGEVLWSEWD